MYMNVKMSKLSIEGELDIIAMKVTATDQDFPDLRDHLQQIDPSLWIWILFSKGDGIRLEVQTLMWSLPFVFDSLVKMLSLIFTAHLFLNTVYSKYYGGLFMHIRLCKHAI